MTVGSLIKTCGEFDILFVASAAEFVHVRSLGKEVWQGRFLPFRGSHRYVSNSMVVTRGKEQWGEVEEGKEEINGDRRRLNFGW